MTAHLDDLAMIRLIDESESEPLRSRAAAHLEQCGTCATGMKAQRRRVARISQLIAAADPPVPALAFPTPSVFRWPRQLIAAGLIGVLAAGVLVQPVRAWIVGWARNAWSVVAGEPAATVRDTTPTTTTRPGAAAVEFMLEEPRLAVLIDSRQSSGTITITRRESGPIRVTVLNGTEREGLLVVPGGIRFDNHTASTADYSLAIPLTVHEVVLTVAGEIIARIDPSVEPGEWTIDVGRARGR